jgi:pimeloyl-ACP methyl ester carboxylesterase
MSSRPENGARPPLPLFLSEVARATAGMGVYLAARPFERQMPRGSDSVLVLPGLMADDRSTAVLRGTLRRLGHRAHAWRLGRNVGPTPKAVAGLAARVEELVEREGPISVVGWSLGGIYARQLARKMPEHITRVVTMGSPFALRHRRQSRADSTFRRFAHLHAERFDLPIPAEALPMPVPATSIYSHLDGIVSWEACLDRPSRYAENIAVYGSHLGLGHHPAVLLAVADRLAQPVGRWEPFVAPPALRWAYPAPDVPDAPVVAPVAESGAA